MVHNIIVYCVLPLKTKQNKTVELVGAKAQKTERELGSLDKGGGWVQPRLVLTRGLAVVDDPYLFSQTNRTVLEGNSPLTICIHSASTFILFTLLVSIFSFSFSLM